MGHTGAAVGVGVGPSSPPSQHARTEAKSSPPPEFSAQEGPIALVQDPLTFEGHVPRDIGCPGVRVRAAYARWLAGALGRWLWACAAGLGTGLQGCCDPLMLLLPKCSGASELLMSVDKATKLIFSVIKTVYDLRERF